MFGKTKELFLEDHLPNIKKMDTLSINRLKMRILAQEICLHDYKHAYNVSSPKFFGLINQTNQVYYCASCGKYELRK
jgi:hypothetical protein